MSDQLILEKCRPIRELDCDFIIQWKNLLDEEKSQTPFSDPEWLMLWWDCFGSDLEQLILAVRKEGVLVGVLPFAIRKNRFCKEIFFMGDPQATHAEPAIRTESAEAVWREVVGYLEGLEGNTLFHFSGLKEQHVLTFVLEKYISTCNGFFLVSKTISPIIRVKGRAYDDYYQNRFCPHKKNRDRRNLQRLALLGAMEFRALRREDMAKAVSLHKSRWKRKLDTSGFDEQESVQFYSRILDCKADRWRPVTLGLFLEQDLLSFELGYLCRGQALLYRSAHDERFNVYALGKMTHQELVRESFLGGQHTVNFGIGYEDYKKEWTDEYDEMISYDFPKGNFVSRFLFLFPFITGSLRNRLKQSRKIILFKRNTLGRIKYFFSWDNVKYSYAVFRKTIEKQGVFRYLRSKKNNTGSLNYQLNLKDKRIEEKNGGSGKIRIADVRDLEEIGLFMGCDPERITRKFYRLERCFIFESDHLDLCIAWVVQDHEKARIYGLYQHRKCSQENMENMLRGILAILKQENCTTVTLLADRGDRMANRAAEAAGFF